MACIWYATYIHTALILICILSNGTKMIASHKLARCFEFHLNLCLALTALLPGSDKVRPTKSMNESYQNGPCWRINKINMGLIRTDFVDDLFIEFPGRPLWCESSLCIALADSRPGAGNVYLTTQQCLSCNKVQKCLSDNKSRYEDVILDTSDPKV